MNFNPLAMMRFLSWESILSEGVLCLLRAVTVKER